MMAVVKANSSDIDLLARLLRAEGEGEVNEQEKVKNAWLVACDKWRATLACEI